jgi:hypothetical protein
MVSERPQMIEHKRVIFDEAKLSKNVVMQMKEVRCESTLKRVQEHKETVAKSGWYYRVI